MRAGVAHIQRSIDRLLLSSSEAFEALSIVELDTQNEEVAGKAEARQGSNTGSQQRKAR